MKVTMDLVKIDGQKVGDLPEGVLLRYNGLLDSLFVRVGEQIVGFSPASATLWIQRGNIYPNWTVAPSGTKITLEQE